MQLSPLSAFHRWKIMWEAITSKEQPNLQGLHRLSHNKNDQIMIESIEKIGIIGSAQISRLFLNNKKKRLKELYRTKVLKKHTLHKDKAKIEVCTLGITAIEFLKKQPNYWYLYNEMDILQRIIFFQLYSKFKEDLKGIPIQIESAPYPYVGKLIINNSPILILVVRQNEEIIKEHLEKVTPSQRIICVCEHMIYLQTLNDHLKKLAVRVTTDRDIKENHIKNMFYRWDQTDWIKENISQQTKTAIRA